jgi:hypothetical protein
MADVVHQDALRVTKKIIVSSPRALWRIRIRHKALRVTNTANFARTTRRWWRTWSRSSARKRRSWQPKALLWRTCNSSWRIAVIYLTSLLFLMLYSTNAELTRFCHADAAKLRSTLEGMEKGHASAMDGLNQQL